MHKSLIASLLLSGVLLASTGYAQSTAFAPRRAQTFSGSVGQPLASATASGLAAQISSFLAQRGLFVPASSLVVSGDAVRGANGVRIYRVSQQFGALPVYGVSGKATVSASGDLVFLTQNFATGTPSVAGAAVPESQALRSALARIYPGENISVGAERRQANGVVFDRTPFFHSSPRVTHVLFEADNGSLERGLTVETWSEQGNRLHETLVGAAGAVLDVVSRTASDSYNVFVEDPSKGAQTVVNGPGAGNAQSPAGWLAGTQTTNHIIGNNADTYLDTDDNNRADAGGTAVANGSFSTVADLGAAPNTSGNKAVAVQNLFFLNNVMHDDLYSYGFTEANGNFQANNFNNGGRGGDPVLAEAQDGGGTDNANFATPNDGSSPRMQMYLWTGAGATHEVQVGASVFGANGAAFGPALTSTGVTAPLAAMVPADGCTAATVSLTGRMAIIDRGSCNFDVKVKNAQAAGAVAAIVANNQGVNESFTMGAGSVKRVTIPSVMVGKADGATLKTLAGASATERMKAVQPLQIDGAVDSDVVFHEYGHGLTWRMIGSMSGALAGAVGEGASDVNAFLLNGDDRIGEYAASDPNGIRRAPYDAYTNTYAFVGSGTGSYEVHNDGEIYAAAMWKFRTLANAAGLTDSDVRRIFVRGMDYTPAAPAFEDMRDGMLNYLTTESQYPTAVCPIWNAFAQFGIGVGADGAVSRRGTVTITESFTVPSSCQP
ncbi:MAG: M36 family metallopeptidase [Vicinamibacterales bacterium]